VGTGAVVDGLVCDLVVGLLGLFITSKQFFLGGCNEEGEAFGWV